MEIEHEPEFKVWMLKTNTDDEVRRFFGLPSQCRVRVVKSGPTTPEDKERYSPDARLFAVETTETARKRERLEDIDAEAELNPE